MKENKGIESFVNLQRTKFKVFAQTVLSIDYVTMPPQTVMVVWTRFSQRRSTTIDDDISSNKMM